MHQIKPAGTNRKMNTTSKHIYKQNIISEYNFCDPSCSSISIDIEDSNGSKFRHAIFTLNSLGRITSLEDNGLILSYYPTNINKGIKKKPGQSDTPMFYQYKYNQQDQLREIEAINKLKSTPHSKISFLYEAGFLTQRKTSNLTDVSPKEIEESFTYDHQNKLVKYGHLSKDLQGIKSIYAEEYIMDDSEKVIEKFTTFNVNISKTNIEVRGSTKYTFNKNHQLIKSVERFFDNELQDYGEDSQESFFKYLDRSTDKISEVKIISTDGEFSITEFKYDSMGRVEKIIVTDKKHNKIATTNYIRT